MALSKKLVQLIIFFIIANPIMYRITSKLPVFGPRIADSTGRPTHFGVFVHALVFVLVSMLVMKMTSNK